MYIRRALTQVKSVAIEFQRINDPFWGVFLLETEYIDTLDDALHPRFFPCVAEGPTAEFLLKTWSKDGDKLDIQTPRQPLSKGFPAVHTLATDTALAGRNGFGLYDNYQSPPEPVIGIYRWIPELNVALVTEQRRIEAFAMTRQNIWIILFTTFITALITTGAAIIVTRSIATPLKYLTSATTRMAAGDLQEVALIKRHDEIGTLANAFNVMAVKLRELINSLEERVAARTAELERYATQMYTAAQISRVATGTLDQHTMLQQSVDLIQDRFKLYYVGIFLRDESPNEISLRADASATGVRLSDHQPELSIYETSMVGWCVKHGQARIAMDIEKESVHYAHPLLPDTRSEMALPLITRDEVIGALAVQSEQLHAFRETDSVVLQTIADQLANAIGNARLYAAAQQTKESAEATKKIRELETRNSKLETSDSQFLVSGFQFQTKIIAVTASSFEEEQAVVLSAGCDDFLRKPFTDAEVFEMLHKHLGIRFVYEEEKNSKFEIRNSKFEKVLTPAALAALPAEWLDTLKQGARRADFILLSSVIAQIRGHDARLAGALTRLAEDFEYDEILELLQHS